MGCASPQEKKKKHSLHSKLAVSTEQERSVHYKGYQLSSLLFKRQQEL